MYLNLYLFDIFITVVEENSFKKAAEKYLLSTSAVSSYMQRLEKSLGKSLFQQTKGKIILTKDGMLTMEYALQFRSLQTQYLSKINHLDEKEDAVKIGGGLISGSYILPKLLGAFNKMNPSVDFSLHVSRSLEIIESIAKNELDLGVVLGGSMPPDLQYYSIAEDKYSLVTTPEFLEGMPQPIEIEHLKELPFVHVTEALRVYQQNLAYTNLERLRLNTTSSSIEVTNPIAAKEIVKSGHYIGYLLQSTIQDELKYGILKEIRIKDINVEFEKINYAIIWKGSLKPVVREFLDFAIESGVEIL